MPISNKCYDVYETVNNNKLESLKTEFACKELSDKLIEFIARQLLHEIILKMEKENQ